jgi:calcium-dependent protein kinase
MISKENSSNNFELRIIDFGLSTFINKSSSKKDNTKLQSLVGTPHYIAPEIFKRSYDEKCDIWSLGVLTYLLFSRGQYPFDADGEILLYKKISKGKFYLPPN